VELRELLKLLSWQGKAILISSHVLSELAEVCTAVVFLVRGKVLRAGPLAQVLAAGDQRRAIHLRLLDRHEEACRRLRALPHVACATLLVDHTVVVDVDGADEACSELLAALVRESYRVVEFRTHRPGLEEVFLDLTREEAP
jgi:ABC-2 type transport system ATP-binding protein